MFVLLFFKAKWGFLGVLNHHGSRIFIFGFIEVPSVVFAAFCFFFPWKMDYGSLILSVILFEVLTFLSLFPNTDESLELYGLFYFLLKNPGFVRACL